MFRTLRFYHSFFKFLSTPSARRATYPPDLRQRSGRISIHALREEGDGHFSAVTVSNLYFYPRPPRGGRRCLDRLFRAFLFDFYPRPPRGGRRARVGICHLISGFLSTPSARRATAQCRPRPSYPIFLSTPSARRATQGIEQGNARVRFLSTPSARRATLAQQSTGYTGAYFYPRPPRGGRRGAGTRRQQIPHFYPRPPRGGRQL